MPPLITLPCSSLVCNNTTDSFIEPLSKVSAPHDYCSPGLSLRPWRTHFIAARRPKEKRDLHPSIAQTGSCCLVGSHRNPWSIPCPSLPSGQWLPRQTWLVNGFCSRQSWIPSMTDNLSSRGYSPKLESFRLNDCWTRKVLHCVGERMLFLC